MQQISSLLDSLYDNSQADQPAIEKTAEARLFAALNEGVEEDPFDQMSLEELTKLAQENGIEVDGIEAPSGDQMEKAAMDALGGQVMAHAAFHELSLIKVAMSNGQCRVCKTSPMDIQGSSICSTCLA